MKITNNYNEMLTDKIDIPGLCLLGYHKYNKVADPLGDHTHENCVEMVLFIKGAEAYRASGKRYQVKGGEVFVAHLDERHGSDGHTQGINEFIWFQLDMSRKEHFLGLDSARSAWLHEQVLACKEYIIKADAKCVSLLKEAFQSAIRADWLYAQGLFVSFLTRLLTMQKNDQDTDASVVRALSYINIRVEKDIMLEELSDYCNMSISSFKTKFKELTQKTPRDFINEAKIEKAKELLKSGLSVTETAFALSFNSSEYFSVVFKKYTGITPKAFAKGREKP